MQQCPPMGSTSADAEGMPPVVHAHQIATDRNFVTGPEHVRDRDGPAHSAKARQDHVLGADPAAGDDVVEHQVPVTQRLNLAGQDWWDVWPAPGVYGL